jgi:Calx-beta domain
VSLSSFAPESAPSRPFFYAAEDSDFARFTVKRGGHDCSTGTVTTKWSTVTIADSAVPGADFESASDRQVELPYTGHSVFLEEEAVALVDDAAPELLELLEVMLHDPAGALIIDPRQAPIYVVDDDGPAAVQLEGGEYSESESVRDGAARIPVFRAGDAATALDVQYDIDPGDASSGADFTTPLTGTVHFDAGDRIAAIPITIVNDSLSEASEALTVSLSGSGVAPATSTTLTILDNEEKVLPESRWHHPRNTFRYPYGDYRIREIHVYADDLGSGVARIHFALRKKLTNGACRWWTGSGFTRGPCLQKKWIKMGVYDEDPPGDDDGFYFYRLPKLASSVRTTISNYTAYARATDNAGNVETLFKVGRNANTFEVLRP